VLQATIRKCCALAQSFLLTNLFRAPSLRQLCSRASQNKKTYNSSYRKGLLVVIVVKLVRKVEATECKVKVVDLVKALVVKRVVELICLGNVLGVTVISFSRLVCLGNKRHEL
jgi:hypothetical protein